MGRELIEMGNGCAFDYGGHGGSAVVYPKGQTANVLADRQARREARHEARRWRHERHGLTPGIELHTV